MKSPGSRGAAVCRGFGPALVSALLGLVLLSGAAWACVLQPFISVSPSSSGPAGSTVTVVGTSFQGPVELRWNGITGSELATASGATFAVPITVPHDPPGLYTILAIARGADGSVASAARAEFLVTAAGSSPVGSASPGSSTRSNPTTSVSAGLAAGAGAGGVVLVALGALGGVRWARRRGPSARSV